MGGRSSGLAPSSRPPPALTLQTAQAYTLAYVSVDLHRVLGLSAVAAQLFLAIALVGGALEGLAGVRSGIGVAIAKR